MKNPKISDFSFNHSSNSDCEYITKPKEKEIIKPKDKEEIKPEEKVINIPE